MLPRLLSWIIALGFTSTFVACGPELQNPAAATFAESPSACSSTSIPNRFIVQWNDGSVSVERAVDKDTFLKSFFKENNKRIRLAEHDQYIKLDTPLTTMTQPGRDPIDWGQTYSEASSAWTKNIKGTNVLVAVIDTGSDITHPQLKNQIYKNPGESGLDSSGKSKETNGIDDDNNGYVDDVTGWNFVEHSNKMYGDINHGTHVAGIILADPTQGSVEGMAPQSKLLPLRFIDGEKGGNLGDALLAIDYAAAQAKKNNLPLVINASWGGSDCSQVLKTKMQYMFGAPILFVTAAGNGDANGIGRPLDIMPVYPAAFDLQNQITVAAYSARNVLAGFSNYGLLKDLAGPGIDIYSTVPSSYDPSGYAYMDGTSMATPFVAGAAAILWSYKPTASVDIIRQAIFNSVKGLGLDVRTKGALNITQALSEMDLLTK